VLEVVSGYLIVLRALVEVTANDFARGGCQADLIGVRVAEENVAPLAPGRTVAFVDDDVREVVLRVVVRQEAGVVILAADVEGLVGANEDAGVLLGVAGRDLGGVVAEGVLEGGQALGA